MATTSGRGVGGNVDCGVGGTSTVARCRVVQQADDMWRGTGTPVNGTVFWRSYSLG